MAKKNDFDISKVKFRYFVKKDGEYVNVDELPPEEVETIRQNFTERLADTLMQGMGYTRVPDQRGNTTA